jgi:adenylylsulfate kinase-like enzyme/SAM-dependent methyltransferase
LLKENDHSADDKTSLYDSYPSVLWITGFSGAGKTTIGRKVNSLLKDNNIKTVFLDGDDLRGIFAGKWGYEKKDRIELAHAYFRLCNTLVAQGVTVVISAVAMYKEIYEWVKENVDRSLIIYLKVPEHERINRDKVTKNIYSIIGNPEELYEPPTNPDLAIENYGTISPDIAAKSVISFYKSKVIHSGADKGRKSHWDRYYTSEKLVEEPSDFAVECSRKFNEVMKILEIGCGNGRDSAFFYRLGHDVTAIDTSLSAISLCRKKYNDKNINFLCCTLPELGVEHHDLYDVIYSRFCLHAMTEEEEINALRAAHRIIKKCGHFFIECRSINDPLARKGEVISPTERISGHYRRFIVHDDLVKRLIRAGFKIESSLEANNLAVLGDDNPVVLRVHAKK